MRNSMINANGETIQNRLIEKGVTIYAPNSVFFDADVDPDRIEPGAVIHPGSRIRGKDTLICARSVIGLEAPATIDNCMIGPEVSLKGGYYKESVFLNGSSTGSGAHVREGTIFEEYASAAHTVGLKQTILFPFVTLGSLINFCDCLMAGGTGPKNHSEVGSSFIHFNFTPFQDKVTPSSLGDVPSGVMLNQSPIFLGGQGGLVGPVRLAYGTVTAAGTICRSDEHRQGRLIFGGPVKGGNIAYQQAYYRNVKNVVLKNLRYIAGLIALSRWYDHVRARFVSSQMPQELYYGLRLNVKRAIEERVARLMAFSGKMAQSAKAYRELAGDEVSGGLLEQKKQLYENRNRLEDQIFDEMQAQQGDDRLRADFLSAIDRAVDLYDKNDYVKIIQMLDKEDIETGRAWLQGIEDAAMNRWIRILQVFVF
jgi:bifunctional UDP-N-acetylglucosamine pyrophosphorylase / glucosamine-1-phosphate N-acetyltransferase